MSLGQGALAPLRSSPKLVPVLLAISALQAASKAIFSMQVPEARLATQGSASPAAWVSTVREGPSCPFRAAQRHPHTS